MKQTEVDFRYDEDGYLCRLDIYKDVDDELYAYITVLD